MSSAIPLAIQRVWGLQTFIRHKKLSSESFLDVGCNDGAGMRTVLELFPEATVAGIDADGDRVKEVREKLAGDVTVKQAFADEMPFRDGEFQWILCQHTLEHCADIPKVLDEFTRVATVGMLIVVPFESNLTKKFRNMLSTWSTGTPDDHQFNTVEPFEWLDFFRDRSQWLLQYVNFSNRNDLVMTFIREGLITYGGRIQEGYDDSLLPWQEVNNAKNV